MLDLTAAVVDLGGDLPVLVPVQAGGLGPGSSPPLPSACGATLCGGHGPGERPGVLDGGVLCTPSPTWSALRQPGGERGARDCGPAARGGHLWLTRWSPVWVMITG